MRVGFFAGAFDPIHDGHLEVARAAVASLELDELNFLIEQKPWGNKQPVALHHRKAMLDLAIAGSPKLKQLAASDNRFTIASTLPRLEEEFVGDELYFIFGADVFLRMENTQWPELEKLLKHYIVVFERGNQTEAAITTHAKTLGIVTAIIPSSHPHHRSTDIRMKPHERTVWLPQAVAKYIENHELYGATDSA